MGALGGMLFGSGILYVGINRASAYKGIGVGRLSV